jgi:Transcriptional regulatory protein, C terminal
VANERLILCGPARLSSQETAWQLAPCVPLRIGGGRDEVHVAIDHISRRTCGGLPLVAADLIDVAAYVYAADQAVSRGGTATFDYGDHWRRHFRFEVAVRGPDIWARPEVTEILAETLGFLSGDDFEFCFTRHPDPPPLDGYLYDQTNGAGQSGFDEVLLFSGGLDSLAGAVFEALSGGRKVALVSHRPTGKVFARQRDLAAALSQFVADPVRRPLHVPVEVNKGKVLSRDFNQRTRSFLFLSVAAVVARALGVPRVRVPENGVVSLNLAISPQLLAARASRSTHPRVLHGFGRLFGLLFGQPLTLLNQFLWLTKADVLSQVHATGHGKLCAMAVSCGGTIAARKVRTHCGRCSQCVDRRLTALAAGLDELEDPPGIYDSDVLTGPRTGPQLTLIERYLGTALHVTRMTQLKDFIQNFPDLTRIVGHVGLPATEAANKVFDLYRRHARQVCEALSRIVEERSADIVRRELPSNCLLSLACGRKAGQAGSELANLPPAEPQRSADLVVDESRFEAVWEGRPCFLRNSKEFWLLKRLNESRGLFVSVATLTDDVWGDDTTSKNTVQTIVSNLRRRLREKGLIGVRIDGSQKGHYRLEVQSESASQASA